VPLGSPNRNLVLAGDARTSESMKTGEGAAKRQETIFFHTQKRGRILMEWGDFRGGVEKVGRVLSMGNSFYEQKKANRA